MIGPGEWYPHAIAGMVSVPKVSTFKQQRFACDICKRARDLAACHEPESESRSNFSERIDDGI
jgi:hypothetical protein